MHQELPSPCICTTLRRATRAITRVYDDMLSPHGLTVQQFAILRNIARADTEQGPGLALPRLADRLVMDRTSLYRALAPLERDGLVAITASGRARHARLTPAARDRLNAANPDWEALQARIHAHFQPGEWDALHATTERLLALNSESIA